jgi:hypothetical protein
MLKYNTLNKFYTGSEEELFTPLTSDYLNSIINQIEINFKDIDNRLSEIENVLNSQELNIQIANINLGNIHTLNSVNSIIDNLEVSSIEITNGSFTTLKGTDIYSKNLYSENISIDNGSIENLLSNYAKINDLDLDKLTISDNYSFEREYIYFNGLQPALKFDIDNNQSNGLRFDSKLNESYARIEFINNGENNSFEIEYYSSNDNDKFSIKSKNIDLDSDIILNGDIVPIESNLGSEINPFNQIYGKSIYGSYYSYNADLAELYEVDNDYEEGTILQVGNQSEGTIADGSKPILGIVSKKYAILLNNNDKRKTAPIALKGRVYCKLSKQGKRGDYIIVDKENPGYGLPVSRKPLGMDIVGILIDPEKNIVKV